MKSRFAGKRPQLDGPLEEAGSSKARATATTVSEGAARTTAAATPAYAMKAVPGTGCYSAGDDNNTATTTTTTSHYLRDRRIPALPVVT